MQRNKYTYKWLLMAWLMLCSGSCVSSALASTQRSSYGITGTAGSLPTYSFKPTSTYFTNTGGGAYTQAIQLSSQGLTRTGSQGGQVFTVKLSNAANHSITFTSTSGGGASYGGSSGRSSGSGGGVSFPTFSFRTTSTYVPAVGSGAATTLADAEATLAARNRILRRGGKNPWDEEPDDDPIGVVPTVPVGEPLVLLVMALLYLGYKKREQLLSLINGTCGQNPQK